MPHENAEGKSDSDVGPSHPGAGKGPNGLAVRQLKRYASWVQNVVNNKLATCRRKAAVKISYIGETLVGRPNAERVIPREEVWYNRSGMLTESEKAYLAGFLDGDGCVMFQLVRRKDYIYGYQVRASVVFYQKTNHRAHLEWIKEKLQHGYLRDRPDGMSEYTIVGITPVRATLQLLYPYLRLKKSHAELAFRICAALPKRFTPDKLMAIGRLVDRFKDLNYSKRRQNTTATLRAFFDRSTAMHPRND